METLAGAGMASATEDDEDGAADEDGKEDPRANAASSTDVLALCASLPMVSGAAPKHSADGPEDQPAELGAPVAGGVSGSNPYIHLQPAEPQLARSRAPRAKMDSQDAERIMEDVKKIEVAIEREAAPREELDGPVEGLSRQFVITTDPFASIRLPQLPPRVTALHKSQGAMKDFERMNEPAPAVMHDSAASPSTPESAGFASNAAQTAASVEQPQAPQIVEIPHLPKLQVVRTVAMEVGDADSQVTVRIEDRGGAMKLHFGAGSDSIHQSLESSLESLVDVLKQEKIHVSNVNVSRKSPIDKVRRMKETRNGNE
jgi:flagellar hook-length control protein FliK